MVTGLTSAEDKQITEQLTDLDTCNLFAIKALGGDVNSTRRYAVVKDDHMLEGASGFHHKCLLMIQVDSLGDIIVSTPNHTQIAQSKNARLSSADCKVTVCWCNQKVVGEIGPTYICNKLFRETERTRLMIHQQAIHGNHFVVKNPQLNRPVATIFDSWKSAATVVWIDRSANPGTSSVDTNVTEDLEAHHGEPKTSSLTDLVDKLLIILTGLKFYYAVYRMHRLPVARKLLCALPPSSPQPELCESQLRTLQYVTLRPFGVDTRGQVFTEVLDLFSFDVLMVAQTSASMVTTMFRDTFGELLFQLRKDKIGNCRVFTDKMIIGQICQNCVHVNHTSQSKLTFTEERDRTFVFREKATDKVMAEVCGYFYNNIVSISLSHMLPLHKVVVLATAALLAEVQFEFHTQCLPQISQYSYLKSL